jgi:hypothetical protein
MMRVPDRVPDREPGCSRRRFLARSLAAAALLLSAPAACSDDTAPVDPVVSGSFVGIVPGTTTTTLVSVYAAPADGSGARQVTVYACDSKERGTIIWFVGQVTGNDFMLASSNGEATVTGTLSASGVTGTMRDAAVTFPFSLRPVRAGEGIYTVTVAASGDYQGVSLAPGGARLEGRFSALGPAAVGATVTVAVIAPDNSRQTATEPSRNATEPGTFRAITVFDGGHFGVRGATFAVTTTRAQLIGASRIIGLDLCCE